MATRHDKYYIEDKSAIFQIGDKLFRVQKRLLVGSESSAFASMFSLPQAQDAEGQTDERPINLQGDSVEEFEALMRVLYPPPLDDIKNIPIATYTRAMRVVTKYSMDDVRDAILRVINSLESYWGIGNAIAKLAFIAEFPGYFAKGVFKEVFVQACSTDHRPSGPELMPLMAYPNLVALMMQYREGVIQPNRALWRERSPSPVGVIRGRRTPLRSISPMGRRSLEDEWLDKQLKSLGLV